MPGLHFKQGDLVQLLSGKDRGKQGKVLSVLPKAGRAVVEGLNIHKRFLRPKRAGEKGQRLEVPSAIWASKLMLICPHCSQVTRSGHESTDQGNFRKCKKCGKLIP